MPVQDDPPTAILHERLSRRIAPVRAALVAHPVFGEVRTLGDLRVFMASHVFAVWDFMGLLKSLQVRLTGWAAPWLPPPDPAAARLVNEIVLVEESDEVAPGRWMSHFELYRLAMVEVGADTGPVDRLLAALGAGARLEAALAASGAPEDVVGFVRTTHALAAGPLHVAAAAFIHGREDVIPEMFERLLHGPAVGGGRPPGRLERALRAIRGGEGASPDGPVHLRRYLARHVEVDGALHGPMARRLLERLCGRDPAWWDEAAEGAERALVARHRLWRGVADRILDARRAPHPAQIAVRPTRQIG